MSQDELKRPAEQTESYLLLCPFCGGEPYLSGNEGDVVQCYECPITIPIKVWQTRPVNTALNRRARWAAFSDEELKDFGFWIAVKSPRWIEREVGAELARRKEERA